MINVSTQSDIDAVQTLRSNRIQWKKEDKTFADICGQIKQNRFNLDPEHQRNVVHNDTWKTDVLHSQIYDGDIPDVYFHPCDAADGSRNYDSLDGKQRCSAIYDYLNDKFKYNNKEPKEMYGKYFSKLPDNFKTFLNDDCTITVRIANRSLSNKEIEKFFQKRQNCKKTTGGEYLNSCITSILHAPVKEYISSPKNIIRLEKAGFKKNDRMQHSMIINFILRAFVYNEDNIDCTPLKLKNWYTSETLKGDDLNSAFELVDHTIDLLEHIKVNGGNHNKNVYVSCAWYIMNYCYNDKKFNIEKINNLKKYKEITLPKVDGNHSSKQQRNAFKNILEE